MINNMIWIKVKQDGITGKWFYDVFSCTNKKGNGKPFTMSVRPFSDAYLANQGADRFKKILEEHGVDDIKIKYGLYDIYNKPRKMTKIEHDKLKNIDIKNSENLGFKIVKAGEL